MLTGMSPLLRTAIFTVVVPGFWTVVVPYWLLPPGARADIRGLGLFALPLITFGVVLYLACAFWGFAIRGHGTPAPIDPPKELVTSGPYSVVRNPMYWSVFAMVLGEAALFRSRAICVVSLCFFAGTILFVFFYEEPALRRKFGAQYEEYCRRVPRWIP